MLTSLKIDNFKCFKSLEISSLARVNLIVGASNVGKTALLEAIGWLPKANSKAAIKAFRDKSFDSTAIRGIGRWLIHKQDSSKPWAKLDAELGTGGSLHTGIGLSSHGITFRREFQEYEFSDRGEAIVARKNLQGMSPTRIISLSTDKVPALTLAKEYDRWTLRTENETRFVDFLQLIDGRLRSLRPMEPEGMRMLFADVGLVERMPLPLLGEGFNRLIQIFGSIIGEDADILLIDEIENGLHWSALPQIWSGIRAAVEKEDVQLFATTHSLECISTAVEAFADNDTNDLAVHRLERRKDGEVHCVTLNEQELQRFMERGWEVR